MPEKGPRGKGPLKIVYEIHYETGRELLDLAENFGTSVHIISLTGEKGNIVKNFGGYCALLRYKI